MHHRMEGQMLNRTQEEMAVTAILALLWVGELDQGYEEMSISDDRMAVFLVGWKSFAGTKGGAGIEDVAIPSRDPCLQDGVYCVYEEYYDWY